MDVQLVGFYLLIILCSILGDDSCETKDGKLGTCKPVPKCQWAIEKIRKRQSSELRRCGFDLDVEIICCPHSAESRINFPEVDNNNSNQRIAVQKCDELRKGHPIPLNLHIIGGEEVAKGEFPHMVALGYQKDPSINKLDFDCGGSLISDTFVLTAAHCVVNIDNLEPVVARTGIIDIINNVYDPKTDYNISEIIVHEYNRPAKYNDICLLRLSKPVEITFDTKPACLFTEEVEPLGGLTVTGWGVTNIQSGKKSTIMLKANLTLTSLDECSTAYKPLFGRRLPKGIIDTQLCAGDPEGKKDACQGDSGGPIQIWQNSKDVYEIVGVTSFGHGCGTSTPGVYTKVSKYLDWIEKHVWS